MIDSRSGALRTLYAANATRCSLVDVPELAVLAIDGEGDPARSSDYSVAVSALMALAGSVRATLKKERPAEAFRIMPLEGVWSLPDELIFAEDPEIRDQLQWTLQVVQSDGVDADIVARSRAAIAAKRPHVAALDRVELRVLPAGPAGQLLHRGPWRDEPATLDRLHRCVRERGGRPTHGHREIYLNDPGRTPPERLKTILRIGYTRLD